MIKTYMVEYVNVEPGEDSETKTSKLLLFADPGNDRLFLTFGFNLSSGPRMATDILKALAHFNDPVATELLDHLKSLPLAQINSPWII